MVKKDVKKRKLKKRSFLGGLFRALWFVVKIPYYLIKGIISLIKWSNKKNVEKKLKKKRDSMVARYSELKIVKTIKGDYKKWEENLLNSDSKIGIILGARGSGKSAFGMRMLENLHSLSQRKCFAIGFKSKNLPSWIKAVDNVKDLENDSFVLIDEAGISFSSRSSMSSANKLLSDLILVARHKNLSIMFISQNSSNLEVNVLRQADYLVLKPSSLLQKDFERKIVQKMYEKIEKDFEKFKDDRGITYIYSSDFTGFVSNSLPSFWSSEVSKGFR